MENEKTLEELKAQVMQQHGITEEQLDNFCAALSRLWEAVKECMDVIAAYVQGLAEAIPQPVQEHVAPATPDADTFAALAACMERLQDIIAGAYISSPPTYDRTDTRNGYYSAKLKSYKNRISSAAIRKPRGVARSCC